MSVALHRDQREEHSSNVPVIVDAAAIVFCWSFAFFFLHPVPTLWYYPLEHRWAFEIKPDGLAMAWYGRTIASITLSLVGSGIAWVMLRRRPPLAPRIQDGWLAAMIVSIVFVVLVIVVTNVGDHPAPEPLPPWYIPR
jgi:hypothetical protein